MSTTLLDSGEPLITLAEALEPYGVHPATGARWCNVGLMAKSGRRVRLEHIRLGMKLKTTVGAVKRFFSALSADHDQHPQPVPSATDRLRAVDAAERALAAAGA